jgi:hypothetical protein
VQCVGFRTDF